MIFCVERTSTNTGISPLRRQKCAAFGRDDVGFGVLDNDKDNRRSLRHDKQRAGNSNGKAAAAAATTAVAMGGQQKGKQRLRQRARE
jgi:hypothetical protein